MPAQWIIFDAMGVIFEVSDDTADLLIPFIQQKNPSVEAQAANTFYLLSSLGKMSCPEFWQAVGLGAQYPAIEHEYLDNCLTIDPEFVDVATMLSGDYSLALLSNDVGEWSQRLRARFALDGLLKVAVVSGSVGLRKPDPQIYRLLLDRLKAPAGDCLFIDDRLPNLEAAAQIGMQVVLFERDAPAAQSRFPVVRSFKDLPGLLETLFPARNRVSAS
jgi:HAD superfamily hydrolase (TIGR01509 family)